VVGRRTARRVDAQRGLSGASEDAASGKPGSVRVRARSAELRAEKSASRPRHSTFLSAYMSTFEYGMFAIWYQP
jgi:hypothetical protein